MDREATPIVSVMQPLQRWNGANHSGLMSIIWLRRYMRRIKSDSEHAEHSLGWHYTLKTGLRAHPTP
jgi:hypothetical protein